MKKKAAIEFQDVSFIYEGYEARVLDGANLRVDFGEVVLLAGYSGEGKSTLLSLACGIIPNVTPGMVEGNILIDGESIQDKKMSEICRKTGVVLQNAEAQIIHQTVEDEVAFGCENFAYPKEKMERAIVTACEQMQLEKHGATRTLSGGQKQRLMTACTLAMAQKILIFDEPLANLDKKGAGLLMETVRKLADAGYAVLVVEHRIDRVLPFVDKMYRIANGKTTMVSDLSFQADIIADERTPVTTEEASYELKGVSYQAGDRTILNKMDLTIKKGEKVLLVGENGCGKTTLLRLLAGLLKQKEGTLTQFITAPAGAAIKTSKEWFRKVGVVYQNPDYQLFMPTVRQEIAFGAKDEAFADIIMERFGLTKIAERHPHSLSEGQKRRVSIAAVLASDPEVLLLDEPTVGQDYEGLKTLVAILNDIHEERKNTMVTVTHDQRCAQALCDRAVLLQNGKNAFAGGRDFVFRYFSDQECIEAKNGTE